MSNGHMDKQTVGECEYVNDLAAKGRWFPVRREKSARRNLSMLCQ